ncbi:MAG: SDR family oxidoreductase [Dehalococcoidia bacterium]|nr:SDR family oxidoreductase [Dehalococcoidia bacterium]
MAAKVKGTARGPAGGEGPGKRTALITGASSGLGEQFARQLAAGGYDLVLAARRKDRLDRLAAELAEQRGVATEVLEVDLSTPAGVAAVEERLRRGDIEMLVNNAGFGTRGEFHALPPDRELQEIDLNVRALARLSHAALESMVPARRGAIINVASLGAFQPVPYMSTYGATKAFVLHFSEGLYEEAKKHGVTVTCLCPGPVKTEFQQVAGVRAERMAVGWVPPEKVVAAALKGARRGQAVVVPGGMNRLAAASVKFLPRFVARRIAGAMFREP